MKAYTDIEQSKILAEILPLESADMWWNGFVDEEHSVTWDGYPNFLSSDICTPCWSLAALLEVLPKIYLLKPILDLEENSILYSGTNLDVRADNIIDACVDMILLLKERSLI